MTAPSGSPGGVARLGARLAAAEARLIRAELQRAGRWVAAATALAVLAAAAGAGAGACLIAAAVLGLATAMPAWLAALIVGVALGLVAGFLGILAREAAKDAAGALQETGERAREEGRWMATLISSNGS
jgi:Putative Actinobacterial Holin-X, holin superfamily III